MLNMDAMLTHLKKVVNFRLIFVEARATPKWQILCNFTIFIETPRLNLIQYNDLNPQV